LEATHTYAESNAAAALLLLLLLLFANSSCCLIIFFPKTRFNKKVVKKLALQKLEKKSLFPSARGGKIYDVDAGLTFVFEMPPTAAAANHHQPLSWLTGVSGWPVLKVLIFFRDEPLAKKSFQRYFGTGGSRI
jgi:hypothetical protein